MATEKIRGLLEEKIGLYQELVALLTAERDCVIDINLDALWESASKKEAAVGRIEAVRRKLMAASDELAGHDHGDGAAGNAAESAVGLAEKAAQGLGGTAMAGAASAYGGLRGQGSAAAHGAATAYGANRAQGAASAYGGTRSQGAASAYGAARTPGAASAYGGAGEQAAPAAGVGAPGALGVGRGTARRGFRLSDLLAKLPAEEAARLSPYRSALRRLKGEVKAMAEENRRFVQEYLGVLDGMITTMTGAKAEAPTYGRSGEVNGGERFPASSGAVGGGSGGYPGGAGNRTIFNARI